MFVVYGFNHPKAPQKYFISGVFKNSEDAKAYLSDVNELLEGCFQWISEVEQKEYPIYLIDERDEHEPCVISRFELAKKMALMEKIENPQDHEYFTYYRFMWDYRGIKKGESHTTTTDHYHIDNDYIIWSLDARLAEAEKNDVVKLHLSYDPSFTTQEQEALEENIKKHLQKHGIITRKPNES